MDDIDFTDTNFVFAQVTESTIRNSIFDTSYFMYADFRDTGFIYSSFDSVYFVEWNDDGATDVDGVRFTSCTFNNLIWIDNNNYNTDPT